jgi:hypothetical protein
VRKFQSVKEKLEHIKEIISETEQSGVLSRMNEISDLADDILKEL